MPFHLLPFVLSFYDRYKCLQVFHFYYLMMEEEKCWNCHYL